jgi:membrane fusion protein, heavy metal efflux system
VKVINSIGDKTYLAEGVQEGDKIIASQTILIYDALNS